ncbi:MAG TPA: hybrid sensor histidine kinase/response regulator [Vicinamibacterales bacterium]|nr:hybrid sensor histidine kinase/response regulator [Vicinamibacterales bacterium]
MTGPLPFSALPTPVRYFVAVSAAVIVGLAARSSASVIDEGGFFLLLSITVLGSAWLAGSSAALIVTVVGAMFGEANAGADQYAAAQTHLALFIVEGLLLTALVAELRHARHVAEREARLAHAARLESEAANRMKDEFLATISHELRTPLNAVLGWVHLIRTGKLDADRERRGFESIDRNVRHQAQLTTDLLDISNALTGQLHLDAQPVSINDAVADAIGSVQTAVLAKDVRIEVSMPDAPVVVRGDATRLRQVVWHLLSNALKFTPREGIIEVMLDQPTPEQARVRVRDSGPGISPEFLPRIFGRFTQADASPTRAAGGLGVGLSLVRALVEQHGGDIQAGNVDGGHGAVFTVRLPVHATDQQMQPFAPMPIARHDGAPSLDGIRILLLDRDGDARELLSIILEQRGAYVQPVGSVAEALEALESWRPDVLVSDTASPEHDSYVLVGKVRSLEADRGGRIPAIALTALSRTSDQTRRLLAPARSDLPKPIEPAILIAQIARLTGRERRRAAR